MKWPGGFSAPLVVTAEARVARGEHRLVLKYTVGWEDMRCAVSLRVVESVAPLCVQASGRKEVK